jgi:hypothetical protein
MLSVNNLVGFGAGGGSSGIQFVGGNTAAKVGDTSGTTTLALNSGLTGGIAAAVSDGDLVIAVFATGSTADRTLSITDGTNDYTLIDSELYRSATIDINLRIAYKFVSGDTATTFGTTGNANDAGAMAVYTFRGVDQVTPLDVAATTTTGGFNAIPDPPTITPSTLGAYIVCVGASGHQLGLQTFTSSDLTDFLTVGSDDTYDATLGIGHKPDWVSGAFNAAQFGLTTSDDGDGARAAVSIALRPA